MITLGASRGARRGFTLVELLVVMTILAIMMGIVFGAVAAARTAARISHTKATITKLHHLIMAKYETYKTRRVPLDAFSQPAETQLGIANVQSQDLAKARLYMIRDIMRQEMPERPADYNPKLFGTPELYAKNSPKFNVRGISFQVPATPLFAMYMSYWTTMVEQGKPPNDQPARYGTAEALYMIVTLSCPGGRAQFSDEEIGDADNDGWPEFIDGWGNPIMFLRWAPRFTDSAIQPNYPPTSQDMVLRHDPFDPMNVEPGAYELIPLIYSPGPDGVYDINTSDNSYAYFRSRSPYTGSLMGQPIDTANFSHTNNSAANGRQEHYDNIHNHRLESN